MVNLKCKYAIGCLIQWYEIELVGEYLQSVKNSLDVVDNKENVIILENSLWNSSLKEKHLLKLRGGQQAFIGDKPFFYHYGRGSTRGDEHYGEWVTEVAKYLKVK